jgi:hypothetical protein
MRVGLSFREIRVAARPDLAWSRRGLHIFVLLSGYLDYPPL